MIWGMAFALVVCIWILDLRARRRRQQDFQAIAERLGLTVTKKGRGIFASGVVKGRAIRFSQYGTIAPGKGGIADWIELEIQTPVNGFTFQIREKELGRILLNGLGKSDLTTGDLDFDKRWQIKTNRPELLRKMLVPELRQLVDAATAASRWGEFFLEHGRVHYREQRDLDGPDVESRFDGLVKMMTEFAGSIEG